MSKETGTTVKVKHSHRTSWKIRQIRRWIRKNRIDVGGFGFVLFILGWTFMLLGANSAFNSAEYDVCANQLCMGLTLNIAAGILMEMGEKYD